MFDHYQNEVKKRDRYQAALIQAFGNQCNLCHQTFPTYIYEYHHLDPKTKAFSLNRSHLTSIQKIIPEAKKCIQVCSNCHKTIEYSHNTYHFTSDFNETSFLKTNQALKEQAKHVKIKTITKTSTKPPLETL